MYLDKPYAFNVLPGNMENLIVFTIAWISDQMDHLVGQCG